MKQPLVFIAFFLLVNYNLSSQCLNDDSCNAIPVQNWIYMSNNIGIFEDMEFECRTGCFTDATPDPLCGFDDIPVVWFKVIPDDLGFNLYVNALVDYQNPGEEYNLVFALFTGSCGNLIPVESPDAPACSTDWNNQVQFNHSIDPTKEYWVAVGAEGNQVDIDANPEFEICISTTVELIICIGDGHCTPDAQWEMISSSNPQQILGHIDPFLTPTLQAGETIEICMEFTYDASATGVDWLHGFLPILGEAWDFNSLDPTNTVPKGNAMAATWFEPQVPILQEPVITVCSYYDQDSIFRICNPLCTPCPCEPGMDPGDPMPGGWFWLTDGTNPGCDNDGTPGEGWGIGVVVVDINFCMEITAIDDFSQLDCNDPLALLTGFQTFSDGVTGCWEDPVGECLLDENQTISFGYECGGNRIGWKYPDAVQNMCELDDQVVVEIDILSEFAPFEMIMEIEMGGGATYRDTMIFDEIDSDMIVEFEENTTEKVVFEKNKVIISTPDRGSHTIIKNPEAFRINNVRQYSRRLKDYTLMHTELIDDPEVASDFNFCGSDLDTFYLPHFSDNNVDGFWVIKDAGVLDTIDFIVPSEYNSGIYDIYFVPDLSLCYYNIDAGNEPLTLNISEPDLVSFNLESNYCQLELSDLPLQSLEGISGVWEIQDSFIIDAENEIIEYVIEFIPNGNCLENYQQTITVYAQQNIYYLDSDQDGFGDAQMPIQECTAPQGYVSNNLDCDDSNVLVNPEAVEVCDGIDNDCNGEIDESGFNIYYLDSDQDGFGDSLETLEACQLPQGYAIVGGDCDDSNSNVYPEAEELCDDLDNDCDGEIDEDLDLFTFYSDNDMDGYGDDSTIATGCDLPSGATLLSGDCDDNNSTVNPGAVELCDEIDNNCDQNIDEGLTVTTYYNDSDQDGYGDDLTARDECFHPDGLITIGGDCNDSDSTINPEAVDIPNNGIDENCDGMDAVSSSIDIALASVNIYPNPSSGLVNIDLDLARSFEIKVYDVLGNSIGNFKNVSYIDFSQHTNDGILLLKIVDLDSQKYKVYKILLSRR